VDHERDQPLKVIAPRASVVGRAAVLVLLAVLVEVGRLGAARAAWPEVRLDPAQLVEFIAQRFAGPDLAITPAADLVLAAACTAQEPTAHDAFDAVLTEVDAAGPPASTRSSQCLMDDVKQLLRIQLLVPGTASRPASPAITARAPLRGWVRITATRELIRHQRKRARETPSERPLDEALADASDPLLSQLKAEYRTEFATALREAIAEFDAEDVRRSESRQWVFCFAATASTALLATVLAIVSRSDADPVTSKCPNCVVPSRRYAST
jgi:hypothetical protein